MDQPHFYELVFIPSDPPQWRLRCTEPDTAFADIGEAQAELDRIRDELGRLAGVAHQIGRGEAT